MLRFSFWILLFLFNYQLFAQPSKSLKIFTSAQIELANTAHSVSYLSNEEKKIFLYINLARMYPQIF